MKNNLGLDLELINKAIEIVKENKDNFCSEILHRKLIQQNFKVGIIKCNKLMEVLESKGIIAECNPYDKFRKVLI